MTAAPTVPGCGVVGSPRGSPGVGSSPRRGWDGIAGGWSGRCRGCRATAASGAVGSGHRAVLRVPAAGLCAHVLQPALTNNLGEPRSSEGGCCAGALLRCWLLPPDGYAVRVSVWVPGDGSSDGRHPSAGVWGVLPGRVRTPGGPARPGHRGPARGRGHRAGGAGARCGAVVAAAGLRRARGVGAPGGPEPIVSNARRTRRRLRALAGLQAARVVPAVSEDAVALIEALRCLPVRHRQALVLHYLLDLPVEEAARTLGVPAGTLESWLARGRKALAAQLGEEEVRTDHG